MKTFALITNALLLINKIALYSYCIIASIYGIWLVVFGFSLYENIFSVLVSLVLGPAIGGFCLFFGMALTPYDYNLSLSETFVTREFINIVIPSLAILFWSLLLFNVIIRILSFVIRFQNNK